MLPLLQGAQEGTGSAKPRWLVGEAGVCRRGLAALGVCAPTASGFLACRRGAELGVFLACLQSAGGSAGLSPSWSVLPQLSLP